MKYIHIPLDDGQAFSGSEPTQEDMASIDDGSLAVLRIDEAGVVTQGFVDSEEVDGEDEDTETVYTIKWDIV